MEKIRVGLVHTFYGIVETVRAEFARQFPQAEVVNIADDSLLTEALAHGGLNDRVLSRICGYYRSLQDFGCVCVLNSCSTVGEAADMCAPFVSIPLLRIDAPMAAKAVALGSRVAVVATASSTIGPSCRLVESAARKAGKAAQVKPYLVQGVYEAMRAGGGQEAHDRLVLDAVRSAARENDVVVLAQGSMHRILPLVSHVDCPVLTSLESGVAQVGAYLG